MIDSVSLGPLTARVVLTTPDTCPPVASILCIDTETHAIEDHLPLVPVVLQTYYPEHDVVHLTYGEQAMRAYLGRALARNSAAELVFHNCGFDIAVLGGVDNPDLIRAVDESRVTDVGMRYLLKRLRDGTYLPKQPWKLDHILKEFTGLELEKNDKIRLTFRNDVPLDDEHIRYAALDPLATWLCRRAMPTAYATEATQVKGSVALYQIHREGFPVDIKHWKTLQAKFRKELEEACEVLRIFGVYGKKDEEQFGKVEGKQKVLQELLANIEARTGLVLPRTASVTKPLIATGREAIMAFPDKKHGLLTALSKATHADKILAVYMNDEFLKPDGKVHTSFKPLVRTGRTSSEKPPMQNPPRGEGVRGNFVALPGHVLYACDYSQIELCGLAEHCRTMYGFSVMGDKIDAGVNLHDWFGYDMLMTRTGGSRTDGKDYRTLAKAAQSGPLCWKRQSCKV